jgi:hypothetical protein
MPGKTMGIVDVAARAASTDTLPPFDHLIGTREQVVRNFKAEGLGSLEVDDRLKLGRPLDRQVARLRALQNLVDECSRAPEQDEKVHPIGHYPAVGGEIGPPARRQSLLQGERGQCWSVGKQHRIVDDHERADALSCHRRKSLFELGRCAQVELVKLQPERLGDTIHLRKDRLVHGIRQIQQDTHVRQARHGLLEQLQPFRSEFWIEIRRSRHVGLRPREAGHDTRP